MGRRPPLAALVALVSICVLIPSGLVLRGEDTLIESDGAYVRTTDDGRGWTIGNDLIRYTVGAENGGIGVRAIENALDGGDWHRSSDPDTFFRFNGQQIALGSTATAFQRASAVEWWGGVRLDLVYRVASVSLEITRSYTCYAGSSVIETWTSFRAAGNQLITLSDLTNFAFKLKNGDLQWISGLDVPDDEGGPFMLQTETLEDGQGFELGADRRASEKNMPWFALKATDESNNGTQFFGSILWSGQWHFAIRRTGDDVQLQLGLPSFNLTLAAGASIETPHAIFGITNSKLPDVALAMRSFIDKGIRHGRPLRALSTYNTWFSYGTFIDEPSMRTEMELAAAMGIEQFVVDAGWWFDIDPDDSSAFNKHWGNWEVDPDRFPNGLGALTDYAHQLGMRFGIWVEPERVDLATVPQFAKERFLATSDGRYDPGVPNSDAQSAQICFADSQAREWITSKLYALLDDVHPDYLKWDNNYWVNCNRMTHGHGSQDGNFQHMRGLQKVLSDLRDRYPDMDIENCAQGGHRLSLDMLAYTDVGYVDDRSAPSTHVRHDLEGLSYMFPPGYLFSFAMGHESEAFDGSNQADLKTVMRSRMTAVLGGTWTGSSQGDDTHLAIANQVALYKLMRPIIQEGSALLLGRQIVQYPDSSWSGWDAIEHVLPRTGEAVVLAFEAADSPDSALVKPRALRPDATYDVESADYGPLGQVLGRELMDRGIELRKSSLTHSHVLFFRPR